MSDTLNLILVSFGVAAAAAYLVLRRFRLMRPKIKRDWSTGHGDACDSCPVIEIRKAQQRMRLTTLKK